MLAVALFMLGAICVSAAGEEVSSGSVTWGIGWFGEGHDGALILDIVPRGPADKLGLVPGDIISSVDGRPIKNSAELKERIKESRPYAPVKIVVNRFGARLEKTLLPAGVLRLEVEDLDRSYRSFTIPGVPKTVFTPPSTSLDALENINVLQNVIIDRKSGQIAVMGIYDPKYSTGPIPYLDLLKTALKFSEPGLNLTPVSSEEKTLLEEITPSQFFEEILGMAAAERERQVLIREMAIGYGLSREEYVKLYNYAYLDAGDDLAPAEIGRILVKAYRHLGSDVVANAYERMSGNTIDDFRQALKILEREKQVEEFSDGRLLTKTQLLVFTCIAMLERLQMPQSETRELLLKAGDQISPAEILQRMYRYVALYLYDVAGAKKEAARAADPKKTIAVSRPIWRAGPKLGLVRGDPARAPMSGDKALVRIETKNIDANSQLARMLYEADYALKAHSSTDLFEDIPGHMTFAEYLSQAHAETSSTKFSYNNNLWFEPKRIEMQISADKGLVAFGAAEMLLKAGFEIHGASREDKKKLIQSFADLAKHVTDNYELYAQAMPAWHSLREAAKVIALARWLKQNKIFVTLDGIRQERWDNPGKVSGLWHRYFIYYRHKSEASSGEGYFHYFLGQLWFGGVNLTGSNWTSYGPASKTTETRAPDQLELSSLLGQKAAQAASAGNLESARHLAELSAQAFTGRVSRGDLAKQNITLPSARTAPLSPARVQLQRELLKEIINNISALRQNPSNEQAVANLSQIDSVYGSTQARTATASDLSNLRKTLRHVLPPPPLQPTDTSPVLAEISLEAFLKLQGKLHKAGKSTSVWIEDRVKESLANLKDELKDQAVDAILDRMPISEALKHEISIQINLMKRYKELFGEMREGTQDFLVGWSKGTSEAAKCLASGRRDCSAAEIEINELSSKFGDRSSSRWQSWLQGDIEDRQ